MIGFNPACFLATYGIHESGTMPPCDGTLVRCHLLPRNLLERESTSRRFDAQRAIGDRRSWVMGCGGLHGNGGHHGMLDHSKRLVVPFDALPASLLRLAEELGLDWWLERTYP